LLTVVIAALVTSLQFIKGKYYEDFTWLFLRDPFAGIGDEL
jgi:hypothetical protein